MYISVHTAACTDSALTPENIIHHTPITSLQLGYIPQPDLLLQLWHTDCDFNDEGVKQTGGKKKRIGENIPANVVIQYAVLSEWKKKKTLGTMHTFGFSVHIW